MARAPGFIVVSGCLLIACPIPAERSHAPTPAAPTVVSEAEPASDPEPGPEMRLLVGGEAGLREFDLDGRLLSTLMAEPCSAPRVLANGEILFLRPAASDGHELVRRTTAGELHPIATLPYWYDEEKCELVDSSCDSCTMVELEVAEQFGIDPSTGEACLGLQDSSFNSANVIVEVWVNLATGKMEHGLQTNRCDSMYALSNCDRLWWEVSGPEEDDAPPAEFPFDFEAESSKRPGPGAIVHAGRAPITICSSENPDYCADETSVGSRSRSERFVLLDGTRWEGTYIHRTVIIFDRSDGSLHMIEDGELAQMVRVKPSEVMQAPDERWVAVVGESDVRWLPGDRLWIDDYANDGLLIDLPGKRVHRIGGDLALRLDGGL